MSMGQPVLMDFATQLWALHWIGCHIMHDSIGVLRFDLMQHGQDIGSILSSFFLFSIGNSISRAI